MRAEGEENPVSLVRCAWAGSQRYGALVWSGDIASTWESFRRQICAGMNMGMAGIPWWTTDIGGFHSGDIRDPAFHELLLRWFQWGTFCPVMRLHGARLPKTDHVNKAGQPILDEGAPNEIWSYGPEMEALLTKFIRIRELIRPYVRALMRTAHETGAPLLRPLFYEFPEDAQAWTCKDEFLFGPDLLVAPVLEPGEGGRRVYLPEGSWTHLFTGETFEGGCCRTVPRAAHGNPRLSAGRPPRGMGRRPCRGCEPARLPGRGALSLQKLCRLGGAQRIAGCFLPAWPVLPLPPENYRAAAFFSRRSFFCSSAVFLP